jgi:hypothetical protein
MRRSNDYQPDMRSVHSRVAFAALDNLIDRHYIMSMRQTMEKVYILLEKDLSTENVCVQGVYATLKNAEDEMWFLMDFNEEQKSYKIEEKVMI